MYGNGQNIRDWLFVEDHVSMLLTLVEDFKVGESFCLGGANELSNLALIGAIISKMQEDGSIEPTSKIENLITYVIDRPGHDQRYAIDFHKYQTNYPKESETTDFNHALDVTISFYKNTLKNV